MKPTIDETHDPRRQSWVASANGHSEFPIQNLPLGIFSRPGVTPRGGVAIGGEILDLQAALEADLFAGAARSAAEAAAGATLNAWMALSQEARRALRRSLSALLAEGGGDASEKAQALRSRLLHPLDACTLHLPAAIGAFTDFYAGIYHAINGARRRKLDTLLFENYKYVPVAYHSRASSVTPSGIAVRRPNGQSKLPNESAPTFGLCRNLDYELELGIWIGAGNALGDPIPIAHANEHIAGFCLLNDWSARDIQQWEMQPLGPFLSKNFGTTISPWVITSDALAPFRIPQPPRPTDDPRPLGYLWDDDDQQHGAFDIELESYLWTPGLRDKKLPRHRLAVTNTCHLYWTVAQMVAHHTCGGCNLAPGDLFGSGTISAPTPEGYGSFNELTQYGQDAVVLASGEQRMFIHDGDEIILRAHARRAGCVSIGFGESNARIVS
jgi:fumarylacetoacetase